MDLVTLVTACALAADPKLMHALVWHQSGGEPWAVAVHGELNPRVFPSMHDAIREAREQPSGSVVRVGLAGVSVASSKVSAPVLLPCRNVAMAAVQIARNTTRCRTHPRLKSDPTFCAVAVYRGSWEQPDVKFAGDVLGSVTKGDAPNFDMPRDTSTEIFDIADERESDAGPPVVDLTPAFAERAKSWSSALFPAKSGSPMRPSEGGATASSPADKPTAPEAPLSTQRDGNQQEDGLFVRRSAREPAQ